MRELRLNRLVCVYVTGYGILLQGLVTYHAEKSVKFVMIFATFIHVLYDTFICPRLSSDNSNLLYIMHKKFLFFALCKIIAQFVLKYV